LRIKINKTNPPITIAAMAPGLRASLAEGDGDGDCETETPGGDDDPGGGELADGADGGVVTEGGGGTARDVVLEVCNCMLQSLPTLPRF
jgi:hypothetical protein